LTQGNHRKTSYADVDVLRAVWNLSCHSKRWFDDESIVMEERRFGKRWPTALNGRIILGGTASPIHCTVRDISDGGARISYPHAAEIPQRFELEIGKGFLAFAEVTWQKGNECGLEFLSSPTAKQ
jgi:hypothetical protein